MATIFRNLIAEVLSALRAGKMDADDNLRMSWKAANLDPRGEQEAAEEQAESLGRLQEIEARAADRLAASGETGTSVVLATIGFRRSRYTQPLGESPRPSSS